MPGVSPRLITLLATTLLACAHSGRGDDGANRTAPPCEVLISVAEQRMEVVCNGEWMARYPVSTSRFGIGDGYGTYKTPLGQLRVCDKIGGDLAAGAVIKHRSATGEVIAVNAPGRDPIVTRVVWLDGMEEQNKNAKARGIYIHGTPEERNIGKPTSYGCIRMRSRDVMALYDQIPVGTVVSIIPDRLPHMHRYEPPKEELLVRNETQPPPASMAGPGAAKEAAMETPKAAGKPAETRAEPPAIAESKPKPAPRMGERESAPAPPVLAARPKITDKSRFTQVFNAHTAELPPISEGPGRPSVSALQSMKGSILMANMPDAAAGDAERLMASHQSGGVSLLHP